MDKCNICNENPATLQVDNDVVCLDCASFKTFTCCHCNDVFWNSTKLTTVDDNLHYCESCFSDYTSCCDDCEGNFSQDVCMTEVVGNSIVCEDCIKNYRCCAQCGIYHSNDITDSCNNCGDYYCENCGQCCDNDEDDCDEERQTSTEFFEGTKGDKIKINRLVGVEIEAIGGDRNSLLDSLDSACGVFNDGSLVSNGVEVVTPPASLDKLEDFIEESCYKLKNANYSVDGSCGLHVHIDSRDIKFSQLSKIYKTFFACEKLLLSMLPKSRRTSTYCIPLQNRHSFKSFERLVTEASFTKKWYNSDNFDSIDNRKNSKYDDTRYMGVNFHSYCYRKTIEIRFHSGTTDYDKIINWVIILLSIYNYSIKRYKSNEIKKLLYLTGDTRLDYFCKLFKINKQLKEYIKVRINRFN